MLFLHGEQHATQQPAAAHLAAAILVPMCLVAVLARVGSATAHISLQHWCSWSAGPP
jgi:hypothetical protein